MTRRRTIAALGALAATGAWAQLAPPKVILVVGPPGSGKTTQSRALAKKYDIPAFSLSDLLKREMARTRDPASKALAAQIASGDILPDDSANDLIRVHLLRTDLSRGFVLDGYPATAGQAKQLDRLLEEQQLPKPVVVALDATDDAIRQRMLKRQRADDKPDAVERRIRDYRAQESMLAEWWGRENFVRVNAGGPAREVAALVARGVDEAMSKRTFAQRP